jgi:hypothetical protein
VPRAIVDLQLTIPRDIILTGGLVSMASTTWTKPKNSATRDVQDDGQPHRVRIGKTNVNGHQDPERSTRHQLYK